MKGKRQVITNADLRKFRRARVGIGNSGTELTQTGSNVVSGPRKTTGESETVSAQPAMDFQFWESVFEEARLRLKGALGRSLVLQLKMNDLRNAFLAEEDSDQQALTQARLDQSLQDIVSSQLEVEAEKKVLEKLQEDARESGLPEWIIRTLSGASPESEEAGLPGFSGYRLSNNP